MSGPSRRFFLLFSRDFLYVDAIAVPKTIVTQASSAHPSAPEDRSLEKAQKCWRVKSLRSLSRVKNLNVLSQAGPKPVVVGGKLYFSFVPEWHGGRVVFKSILNKYCVLPLKLTLWSTSKERNEVVKTTLPLCHPATTTGVKFRKYFSFCCTHLPKLGCLDCSKIQDVAALPNSDVSCAGSRVSSHMGVDETTLY